MGRILAGRESPLNTGENRSAWHANLVVPFALKLTGMFWDVHDQYDVLERLAEGAGYNSGHHRFAEK